MAYNFVELDEETRTLMLEELGISEQDAAASYIWSSSLTERGKEDFLALLRSAVQSGTEETLISELKSAERVVSTPANAAEKIGATEFNRYYIRAVCRRAQNHGENSVKVYRAKVSLAARVISSEIEGSTKSAPAVLMNLRSRIGMDTESGLGRVNSGLTVRCTCVRCATLSDALLASKDE